MREHMGLYRGKRIDNDGWAEGSLHIEWGETTSDGQREKDYRILGMRGECYYVDPDTVGEFVGRFDKNNNPIFEGDIVDASSEWWDAEGPAGHTSPFIAVLWDEDRCCFEPFGLYDCDCGVYISAHNCKVIGNIYDTPELWGDEN